MHTPKTLLVTGAAGFIGTNFCYSWMKKYPDSKIIAIDLLTYAGNEENLMALQANNHFTFVHGDILETEKIMTLLEHYSVDTIVHFAAESHVDKSIKEPTCFFKTNIEGTHSLLQAARYVWLSNGIKKHRFHHVSTDEVYGSLLPNEAAFTERSTYLPSSPYAASKASADHIVRSYHQTYGLDVTISHCSNNYGPYQFTEKLIPLIIKNCLTNQLLPIYGDGQQIRDWLFVDDHNKGIDLIIHNGLSGESYNIGGNNERKNIDIVYYICNLLDEYVPSTKPYSHLITYVTDRLGHDRRYAIDCSKMINQLGYQPEQSFETGMKHTVLWYLNNREWWQND